MAGRHEQAFGFINSDNVRETLDFRREWRKMTITYTPCLSLRTCTCADADCLPEGVVRPKITGDAQKNNESPEIATQSSLKPGCLGDNLGNQEVFKAS